MSERGILRLLSARPLSAAVLLTLLWHAVLFAADWALPTLSPSWFPRLGPTVINLLAAVIPIGLIAWAGWWRAAGLVWQRPNRTWWYAIPILLVAAAPAVIPPSGRVTELISTAVLCLAVGVSEESLSRGVNQHLLLKLGPARAVIWVAVLFGLGHALSGAWFGQAWDDTAAQVVEAGSMGYAFAALRLYLGTIWPLVSMHALDDFLQLSSPGATPQWLQIAGVLVHLGYGSWLIRRLPAAGSAGH